MKKSVRDEARAQYKQQAKANKRTKLDPDLAKGTLALQREAAAAAAAIGGSGAAAGGTRGSRWWCARPAGNLQRAATQQGRAQGAAAEEARGAPAGWMAGWLVGGGVVMLAGCHLMCVAKMRLCPGGCSLCGAR
jgi:hypothetical protein